MNNLDWSNSVVAQTMMRGYPIFGENGLNISSGSGSPTNFGSDSGGSPTNFSAYLDLEPTFELNVENFIAYLESEESRLYGYTIQALAGKGSTRGSYSNYIPAGVKIGLAHLTLYNSHAYSPEKASFDLLYGEDSGGHGGSPGTSSTYKRDALRFIGGNGANDHHSFLLVETRGPALLRHPCNRPLQTESTIRFTQAYLDAIDELPSDFDYQAYLRFGTRFGRGYVSSLDFSHTEIRIASKVYVTLGSKNYTETNCQDPPFNMLTYGVFRDGGRGCYHTVNALTDDQRSKLETFENNLFRMIRKNTKAPTTSPTRTPTQTQTRVPSFSPTSSPTSVPVSLSTSAAATSTCFTSKLPVALALALFSFLPQ